MVALKRAVGVLVLQLGDRRSTWGDWRRGPLTSYFLAMSASRFSALTFSGQSGSVAVSNVTLGRDFDPFGHPRHLGASRMWQRWVPMIPHASVNLDGPGAPVGFRSLAEDDKDGANFKAATCSCSVSWTCLGSNGTAGFISRSSKISTDLMDFGLDGGQRLAGAAGLFVP